MERIIDIALVLACCTGLLAAQTAGDLGSATAACASGQVTALLLAVIASAGCQLTPRPVRTGVAVALAAASCMLPGGIFVTPVAFYELMRGAHGSGIERVGIAAAPLSCIVALSLHPLSGDTLAALLAVFALAGALSLRTRRIEAQTRTTRRIRDDLQQRALTLQCEQRDLQQTLENLQQQPASAAAAPPARPHVFASLTDREYEVVRLVADGLDNQQIAEAAFVSEGTVRNRISTVLSKTGLRNRTQIAVAWWRNR